MATQNGGNDIPKAAKQENGLRILATKYPVFCSSVSISAVPEVLKTGREYLQKGLLPHFFRALFTTTLHRQTSAYVSKRRWKQTFNYFSFCFDLSMIISIFASVESYLHTSWLKNSYKRRNKSWYNRCDSRSNRCCKCTCWRCR